MSERYDSHADRAQPGRTVSRPPVQPEAQGHQERTAKRMMPSWTTSVATDALMPEKRE